MRTLILSVVICLLSSMALAQYKQPLLVMDMSNAARLPKNFRVIANPLPAGINTKGLLALHIAGGSQYSKLAFQSVLFKLRQKHIVIMDLRQESHGFLNSNAVSWYAPNDAINADKTDSQIEEDQTKLLEDLSKQDVVDVFTIVKKSAGYVTKVKAKQYVVHQVMSEAQFAQSAGQNYEHLYVQDYHAPDDQQVDRFLAIVKQLPKDKWIYFHCRAGVGRTTTFMAMFDMLHNAKQVSLEDILARQHALGGKDLTAIESAPNKKLSSKERLTFLHKFYEYAKTNEDDFATTWTDWLGKQTDNATKKS